MAKHVEEKVNINTATKQELMQIPQMNDSRAEVILRYRDSHGDFSDLNELHNIMGLGDTLTEGFKDFLTVGDHRKSTKRTPASD